MSQPISSTTRRTNPARISAFHDPANRRPVTVPQEAPQKSPDQLDISKRATEKELSTPQQEQHLQGLLEAFGGAG